MKVCKILFLSLLVMACDSDDQATDVRYRQYTGNYKIVSFKSDIAVDLDHDGIASNELMDEIGTFDSRYDLKIRPNDNESSKIRLLDFSFPKTYLRFSPTFPEGRVSFLGYGFTTRYQFENSSFKLEDTSYVEHAYINNVEADKTVYLNSHLKILDPTHLTLTINKKFYDFSINEWIMLEIEVVYEKQ